jgi:hypothetical protein
LRPIGASAARAENELAHGVSIDDGWRRASRFDNELRASKHASKRNAK